MTNFDTLYNNAVAKATKKMEECLKAMEGFDTITAHAGHSASFLSELGYPVVPPITLSSTFQHIVPGTGKYIYSRLGNYSRDALETCLKAIDNAEAAIAFGSGLAAVDAVLQLLSHGDHVVSFSDLYGGTSYFFREIAPKHGLTFDFVDMRDPKTVEAALKPSTKLVYLETPSNPLMRLVDIAEVARIAHNFNKDIIVVVDNTFMTPFFQRPLDLGADVVLYSCTKYLNGHADVVMGSLAVRKGLPEIAERLHDIQHGVGAIPSPFDCYLCLRGLRTLGIRMRQHMLSGLTIAAFLSQHPKVEAVLHPGLESHPQYELAVRQMNGFSGMLSFYLKATGKQTCDFAKSRKVFCLAVSLGGFESLIEIPSLMTHANVPVELREKLGITDSMLRMSVGIEGCRDLAKDLYDGLEEL